MTAQLGTLVTAPQLLGEEEQELERRTAEAEKEVKKLLKRMKKAGIKS